MVGVFNLDSLDEFVDPDVMTDLVDVDEIQLKELAEFFKVRIRADPISKWIKVRVPLTKIDVIYYYSKLSNTSEENKYNGK